MQLQLGLGFGLGIVLGLAFLFIGRALFAVDDSEARKTVLLFALAELEQKDSRPHDGYQVYGISFGGALLPWFADGSADRLFRELVKSGLVVRSPSPRRTSFPEWFIGSRRDAYVLTDVGREYIRTLRDKTRQDTSAWNAAMTYEAYRG